MFREISRGFRRGFGGRGFCGFGFGFGGFGRGWRNLRYCRRINANKEKSILEERLQFLKDEIKAIEERIAEIVRGNKREDDTQTN